METHRIEGTTALVSGGSSGVGLAVAKGLARLGARTVLLSRDAGRGRDAVRAVQQATPGAEVDVESRVADLTSPASVARLVDELGSTVGSLDVLVNATGSVGERGDLRPGIPRSFATNALTHHLLTRAALPLLRQAPEARVLTVGVAPALVRRLGDVAVDGVDANASGVRVLTQAVAWKLLLSRHLAETEPGISAVVFHPGLIRSDLLGRQALPLRLLGSVANRFARSTCPVAEHLASRTADLGPAGGMVDDRGRTVPLPASISTANAARSWAASERLVGELQ